MLMAAIGGCGNNGALPAKTSAEGFSAKILANLNLAIIDDPDLAASISTLLGEWKAQTGSELTVQMLTAKNIAATEKLDADAVIYPSALLGTLAEQHLIRPLNGAWLKDDPLETADLLQPPNSLEFTWDGQPFAVPLGSPQFVLLYRPNLFQRFGKQPPRTWEEYQQLAGFFNNLQSLRKQANPQEEDAAPLVFVEPWSGAVEPLAPGWAARMLLARAAAYAKHRDYFSVLFDRETMEPLIAGPPFVRALTQLVVAAKSEPKDATSLTPANAARLLLTGHAAMAITWPSAAVQIAGEAVPVAFANLPGATEAYNPRHAAYEPRRPDEAVSVPLRGISGRVGSVVRGTNSPEAAFQLLTWLTSKRWSSQVLPPSSATALFRDSQLDDPQLWSGQALSTAEARQYGDVLATALHQTDVVWMPRIPGEAEYVAALDEAVKAAIDGKKSPQQALDESAAQWKQITAKLGVDQQLEAYRRSLKTAP